MNFLNKLKIRKQIILNIINFQIIAINCKENVPKEKIYQNAILIGKKKYIISTEINILNKLKIRIQIILYIINFQIIAINCQGNVTIGRIFHTATLVGKKIYFLDGYIDLKEKIDTNHFFCLDISKPLL